MGADRTGSPPPSHLHEWSTNPMTIALLITAGLLFGVLIAAGLNHRTRRP
jgi:hypothetical protein